jgi:hypothetical protein
MTQMKDSGKRQNFKTGAVRDAAENKPRPDLISPYADEREGEWMRLGAEKYAERNWEQGIPISRCIASLRRHLMAYMMGKTDEDHMAAVRTNASFILHFEHEIAAGRLPASLDDMPKYEQRGPHSSNFKTEMMLPEQFNREYMDEPDSDWLRSDERKQMHKEFAQDVVDGLGLGRYDDKIRKAAFDVAATAELPDEKVVLDVGAATDSPSASKQHDMWPDPSYQLSPAMRKSPVDDGSSYPYNDIRKLAEPGEDTGIGTATESPQRPTLYIAGPMRGKPRLNWDAFFEAERRLQEAGYNTINPARLDEKRGIDPDTFDVKGREIPQDVLRRIVQDDLAHIIPLDPAHGDGIALLDDANASTGASAEVAVATWLRLPFGDINTWVGLGDRSNKDV